LIGVAGGESASNPPITNTAVSGMPTSMAGVAASLASTGRQIGITLGIAISGTIVGSAPARGGTAYTKAEHGVWWLLLGLGLGILALGLLSTGRWASDTAARAAALVRPGGPGCEHGAAPSTAPPQPCQPLSTPAFRAFSQREARVVTNGLPN